MAPQVKIARYANKRKHDSRKFAEQDFTTIVSGRRVFTRISASELHTVHWKHLQLAIPI